tara:strand:+ start:17072 stop:18718 length:1647 start_codon:yes stop_codon:yes gene_type:complete
MEQPPVAQADGDDIPRILYLNRCVGGCTLTPGQDDAINNTSGIVNGTSLLAEFPYGDEVWNEVVECVRDQYALFNINITDQDPGDALHFESIVAGYAEDIGAGGAGGIAPFSCGVWGNSINFTFAETLGGNAQLLCEVVAQESGHVMGLEHALLCEDPMTYLNGCGPKKFQNIDAECGESTARPCDCGNATQNSVQHLVDVFGPGDVEPTAEVTIMAVSEDPDGSDGNAVADPGEALLIDVVVKNIGNATTEEVEFKINSGGHLKLRPVEEPVILGAGLSATVQLVADVRPSACGREVEFEVTTSLEQGDWSDSAAITSGIGLSTYTSSIATDEPWQADEEAAAQQGAWEYGIPEQTIFAGRIVQAAGSSEGAGTPYWSTGLTGAWDESSLVGTSTLETSSFDVGTWYTITGIEYRLWHLAYDRSSGGLEPSPDAHLIVELSTNDGKSWKEVDRIIGEDFRWDMREATFDPIEISSEVKLRFIVSNDGTVDDRLIEIGIDQVTLQGGELNCTPTTSGCGCSATASSRTAWIPWMAVLMLLWIRRRQRA